MSISSDFLLLPVCSPCVIVISELHVPEYMFWTSKFNL